MYSRSIFHVENEKMGFRSVRCFKMVVFFEITKKIKTTRDGSIVKPHEAHPRLVGLHNVP